MWGSHEGPQLRLEGESRQGGLGDMSHPAQNMPGKHPSICI